MYSGVRVECLLSPMIFELSTDADCKQNTDLKTTTTKIINFGLLILAEFDIITGKSDHQHQLKMRSCDHNVLYTAVFCNMKRGQTYKILNPIAGLSDSVYFAIFKMGKTLYISENSVQNMSGPGSGHLY